jgi:cell division protein FtsB
MHSARLGSLGKKSPVSRARKIKKPKNRFEYWVIWLLFLALFFIFLSIFGENGLLEIGYLKKVRLALKREVFELQRENDALRKEIEGLNKDPFFIEKMAREELDLVLPHEVVYHFVPSSSDAEGKSE